VGLVPVKKKIGSHSKGKPSKIRYAKSEGLTVISGVTVSWSKRVNLYNWQTVILPSMKTAYAT
jgi:hypothetical protein